MKKALKYLLYLILLIIVVLGGLILYATISDYKPDKETLVSESDAADVIRPDKELSLLLWNIGYCGLSKEMDFFYDGGKGVRTNRNQVMENIGAVGEFLIDNYMSDIFLFQEVDKKSKRSYRQNEVQIFGDLYSNYYKSYGKNYDVFFVPLPPTTPLGKVNSGLLTMSRYRAAKVTRHSFPGNYSWPMGLFMLDRCFMVSRYPVENGKTLLVINSHNSAYDDGNLRKQQMEYLKGFLLEEYEKGNYIIMGADWNQCPPGIRNTIEGYLFDNDNFMQIEKDYLPEGWTWLYDNEVPTNRRLQIPYDKEKTLITVIDFFLISPNIEAISIEGINLKFVNSDHNPVRIKVKLTDS